jgi:phosphatidylglycerol:prolipoprotein diacylglycerol transferase
MVKSAVWPEAHSLWSLQFTLYDVMRGIAIVCSLVLCTLLNRRQGIPVRGTLLIALIIAPLSVCAARLLNAFEAGATLGNAASEFLRNSGSSIYGALFACFVSLAALTRMMHLSMLRFLDAGAPAIAVGEALSRVGCFCAGCCYGETWNGPWAVTFPIGSFAMLDQSRRGLLNGAVTHSLPVHPVQLYGVVLMSLLGWGLIWRFLKPHPPGQVFFLLLIGYGAYRLAIIPFRVEALPTMKVFSMVFIAAGVVGLLWNGRMVPSDE